MEEKSKFKLFIHGIFLVVLLFGLINIINLSYGKMFYLELMGFLFLLLLTLISFIAYKNWGERVLFVVYLFYLINLILVWYLLGPLYLILLFLALLGFLMSIPKTNYSKLNVQPKLVSDEPHSEVFDVADDNTVVKTRAKTTTKKPAKTSYSPGKLVASKASNIYHLPKCEWAKKIKSHRRVWFKNKEEAWEKGYRAHSCVG